MAGQHTDFCKSSNLLSKTWKFGIKMSLALNPTKSSTFQQIERLDQDESVSGLSEEDFLQLNKLKEEILDIIYKEEISWKQKSRLHWLKHGDTNTSFFHKVANGRKARNFISSLNINGSLVEGMTKYRSIFSTRSKVSFQKSHQLPLDLKMGRTYYLQTVRFMVGKGIYFRKNQICCFRPSKWQSPRPGWFPHAFLSRTVGIIKDDLLSFFFRISSKWKDPQRHQLQFLNLNPWKDWSLLCSRLSTHKSYLRASEITRQSSLK